MGWQITFKARPFQLDVARTATKGGATWWRPFALPDSLYRMAVRRVVARLLEENRQLRMSWNRPPSVFAAFVVWVADRIVGKHGPTR